MNEYYLKVKADRWFQNGDHPDDNVGQKALDIGALGELHPELFDGDHGLPDPLPADAPYYIRLEGAVVRFFRNPDIPGEDYCEGCSHLWRNHGWIDEGSEGYTVHPGDWIVTIGDKHYPYEPAAFAANFVPIERGTDE